MGAIWSAAKNIPIFKISLYLIADANARLKKALNRNQICGNNGHANNGVSLGLTTYQKTEQLKPTRNVNKVRRSGQIEKSSDRIIQKINTSTGKIGQVERWQVFLYPHEKLLMFKRDIHARVTQELDLVSNFTLDGCSWRYA